MIAYCSLNKLFPYQTMRYPLYHARFSVLRTALFPDKSKLPWAPVKFPQYHKGIWESIPYSVHSQLN